MHFVLAPETQAKIQQLKELPDHVEDLQDAGLDLEKAQTLVEGLRARVVFPWDSDYLEACKDANTGFQSFPLIVVFCETIGDIRFALRWAHRVGWGLRARSGRHSYAGFCNRTAVVLLDTSLCDDVHVGARHALIGAGATVHKVTRHLNDARLTTPVGNGETVGFAGYMQGGGYGFTSRLYGMSCDNVEEFRMVLADGTLVTANQKRNHDLFWAVRGGTGGNFGILVETTYRLHHLYLCWGFRIQWPLASAPEAMALIQSRYTRTSRAPLGYLAGFTTNPDSPSGRLPVLVMFGIFDGSAEDGRREIEPLLEIDGAELQVDEVGTFLKLNTYLLQEPYQVPNASSSSFAGESGYVARPVERKVWENVCEFFKQAPNAGTNIAFEPYGGAINRVPVGSNAFIHRDVDMDVFATSFWAEGDQEERTEAEQWLATLMDDVLGPSFNGHSYQNYPNRRQTDYRQRYWGSFFPYLLEIKKKYDPDDFFRFEQSISPPPEGVPQDQTVDEAFRRSIGLDEAIMPDPY